MFCKIMVNNCRKVCKMIIKVTHEVDFVMTVDDRPAGTITIGLFGGVVPRTVDNFVELGINGS